MIKYLRKLLNYYGKRRRLNFNIFNFNTFLRKQIKVIILVLALTLVIFSFYFLPYKNLSNSLSHSQNLSNAFKSNSCHIAYVTSNSLPLYHDNSNLLIDELSSDIIYSLNKHKFFEHRKCSLRVFSLMISNEANQSFTQHFFEQYKLTLIYVNEHQPFSNIIKNLAKIIENDAFTTVLIHYKLKLYPFSWQLVDLARNIPNKTSHVHVYYLIQTPLDAYPNVEQIGAIRQMAFHSTHLIATSLHSYYSLKHAYGVNEVKLLYLPQCLPILNQISKTNQYLESILSKFTSDDLVVFIGGLLNPQNGLELLMKNFKRMVAEIPNLKLLIAGQTNNKTRQKLIDSFRLVIASNGFNDNYLLDKITWINSAISLNEAHIVYKKIKAYLIFYNESMPSTRAFLNLMSNGIPIISTPYRYSIEMISHERGFIIPLTDGSKFIESLIQTLKNESLLVTYGRNGQAYVKKWNRINFSNQLVNLFKKRQLSSANVRKNFNSALSPEFDSQSNYDERAPNMAYWKNYETASFDSQDTCELLFKHNASTGIYTLYSDFNIQLNIKINITCQLETVALRGINKFVILDLKMGIEEFKLGKSKNDIIIIDYKNDKILVESINVKFELRRVLFEKNSTNNEIRIEFLKLNRFTHAYGLFGSTIRHRNDLDIKNDDQRDVDYELNPMDWHIDNNDYFSHFCKGQTWSKSGINSNVFILEENDLIINETNKMSMFIEGQIFLNSGFGAVNRRMYLELFKNENLNVFIRADRKELRQDEKSVEILLTYSLFLRQEKILKKKLRFYTTRNYTISFRNSYPPKMRIASKNTIIIIQQPWEYHGMPRYWIPYFENTANEVWVPTNYCKNSLIANGLSENKINVISHGVYYEKFQLDLHKLKLPTNKTFKYLTVGGLLLRKGIDVLIKAYTSIFTNEDDVTLIIHCIYKLGYDDNYIKQVQENPKSPEIVFIEEPLSEIDMIRLFKSVDVYVSPYRSEGFGLTILEAMAAGLPPIVTHAGASLDFCPPEGVYFIEATDVACLEFPCGKMKAFQYPTFVQPSWAEPKVESLADKMLEAYKYPEVLKKKAKFVREFAKNYTWDNIIDLILKRIFFLVDRHVTSNF